MSIYYQLAGFEDGNGHLGRQVPAGQIIIPQEIWLDGGTIRWRRGEEPRKREVSRTMLNRFVRLTEAKSILAFAKEWGVLAISGNLWTGEGPGQYYLPGRDEEEGSEPISAWQYYSKRAQALLNVAARLKLDKLGELSDWDKFAKFVSRRYDKTEAEQLVESSGDHHSFGLGFSLLNGYGTPEERLEVARGAIASEIGAWMDCWKTQRLGRISDFALRWVDDHKRWALQIDYHGLLFPAIALQLALVVAEADSLYSCSGCGLPYIRKRGRKRPKSGCANYCDQCSKDGVAQRRAVQSYREKKSEANRLRSEGISIRDIADRLSSQTGIIQGWFKKDGKNAKTKTRK